MSATRETMKATQPASLFRSTRAAKEYLAGKIVDEAEREGTPLNEIERKMLYFSETGWTLPDMMTVNAEFDRNYAADEYERKIGGLVARLIEREEFPAEQETWDSALMKLADEDHYLLVLIDASGPARPRSGKLSLWLPSRDWGARRPQGDARRLFVVALVFTFILLAGIAVEAFLRR